MTIHHLYQTVHGCYRSQRIIHLLTRASTLSLQLTNRLSACRAFSMQSVFVYGTLKRNQPNHGVLVPEAPSGGRANFVGMARTMLRYPLVIAGRCHVPYLLDTPGRGEHVLGEVWNVDEAMLVRLDKLENHPAYYQRDAIAVRMLSDGTDGSDAQEKDAEEKTAVSYFLRNYKPELDALEMLQNFDANRGEKRYIPIKCRSPGDTLNQTLEVLVAYKP